MTDRRHEEIGELFHAALERPPRERSGFLSEACSDDGMRREVEALLAADESASSFIEDSASKTAEDLLKDYKSDLFSGRVIGQYRIKRKISHGGMGAVYLAGLASGATEERVAIKLIKPGMGTEEVVRRFRAERQTLADLDHPNIAKLVDGGATDEGLPYLVMEYVEGRPIDSYCDEMGLGVTERMELFRSVCAAVNYAHQNLIVHRDLKPSNILVTGDGTPKLLDFGIAKLLNPGNRMLTTELTRTAMRLMTPEYASPEQVRGEPITTASDVYSLGVVLYELLTGQRPYRFASRLQREIEHVVCETMPEKPSLAVGRTTELRDTTGESQRHITPDTVRRTRGLSPEKLSRYLAGDVDTIVLMALRKEPQRRYTSVEQFSDDLRRYLTGMPVIAQKDTFGYRAGKFARRHKRGMAVTCLVVACLIGTAAVTTWQAVLLRKSEAQAQNLASSEAAARELAEHNGARAEQINQFLQEMLASVEPGQQGSDVTVREVLDAAAQKLNVGDDQDAEVAAALRGTIGEAYQTLGLFAEAIEHLTTALQLRIDTTGARSAETARSHDALAFAFNNMGSYEDAEEHYLDALSILRELHGEEHEEVALVLCSLGTVIANAGDYAEGERLTRDGVNMLQAALDASHPSVAKGLHMLATQLATNGDYREAEPLFREALKIRRGHFGDQHILVAATLSRLGWLLVERRDFEAAEPILIEAVALRKKLYGNDHYKVAQVLNYLGLLCHHTGRLTEAEAHYREALAINREVRGDEDYEVAKLLNNIAGIAFDREDYAAAEPYYREATDVFEKVSGREHPVMVHIRYNLARCLHEMGDYQAAEPICREALELASEKLPATHPARAKVLTRLGMILIDTGRSAEAEGLLREGLRIRIDSFAENDALIGLSRSVLGECLTALGNYDEAEGLLLSGYEIIAEQHGADHKHTRDAIHRIVNHYEARDKSDAAASWRASLSGD